MKYFRLIIIIFSFAWGCASQSSDKSETKEDVSISSPDSIKTAMKKTRDSIFVIDTTIDVGRVSVFWFSDGQIKFKLNNTVATMKFFAYDANIKNKAHKSIVISNEKSRLTNFLFKENKVFFSLTDFKGRANIFGVHFSNGLPYFYTKQSPFVNPIVNESSYILIDHKEKIILNATKRRPIDMDENPQGWDFYIYSYTDSTFSKPKLIFISNKDLKVDDNQRLNESNAISFYERAYKKLR